MNMSAKRQGELPGQVVGIEKGSHRPAAGAAARVAAVGTRERLA
jgi:hypothetical protein